MAGENARAYYETYWTQGLESWSPSQEGLTEDEQELLSATVREGTRIVDIGCGEGRVGRALDQLGVPHRYFGLDISAAAVHKARASGLDAEVCDLDSPIMVRDGEVDVVLCFEVLEHLFRPDELLKEAFRMLRHGGRLVGSVPNIGFLPNRILFALGRFNPGGSPATSLHAPWRDPHIRFFTPRVLAALLKEIGFSHVVLKPQRFALTDLPLLYRASGRPRRMLVAMSRAIGWLGKVSPTLWSARVFFDASHS